MIKLWSSDGVHAAPPDDQSLHLVSSRTRVIEVAVHKSAWLVYVSKIGYLSWHIFFLNWWLQVCFSVSINNKSHWKILNLKWCGTERGHFYVTRRRKKRFMFRFSKAIRKSNSVWVFTLRIMILHFGSTAARASSPHTNSLGDIHPLCHKKKFV